MDVLNTRFYDPVILSSYSPRIDVDGHGQLTFQTVIVTILYLAFLEIHSREMLLETMDMLNVIWNKTKAIGGGTDKLDQWWTYGQPRQELLTCM